MFLFLAINFHNKIKSELHGITEMLSMQSFTGNFTNIDNFHLTLVFIGETDVKKVPQITGIIDSVAIKPFTLELGGIGKFGNRGGDIWWYGVQMNNSLKELNEYLTKKLRTCGFNIENRSYKPHITLGREVVLKKEFNKADFERLLPLITVPVNRISLMKSERVHGETRYIEVYGKSFQ